MMVRETEGVRERERVHLSKNNNFSGLGLFAGRNVLVSILPIQILQHISLNYSHMIEGRFDEDDRIGEDLDFLLADMYRHQ